VPKLIQAPTFAASGTSSVSQTVATPTKSNLLLAAVYANVNSGNFTMTGWDLIKEGPTQSGAASVAIFGRYATGTEGTSITASATGATNMKLQVVEWSGIPIRSTIASIVYAAAGYTGASATTTGTQALVTGEIGGIQAAGAPMLLFAGPGTGPESNSVFRPVAR
jgi:hypothetical protein